MPNNQDLAERDLKVLWHPCTQMKDHEQWPPIPIRRAFGVWLEDFEGTRYLDAISSWWVNLFGHAHPAINAALKDQLDTLEHVLLAGFTHEPAISLAERLTQIAPKGLTRCFYADNGSSAVEVALKMSVHYWRNQGQPQKTRFMTLQNSYHGETLGALGVGDVGLYRETYDALLLTPIRVMSPDAYQRSEGETAKDVALRAIAAMKKALDTHGHEVAAVIIEPLVQCAGGMRMYDPSYLTLLREACDHYGVHLIADEIAVGFGRTGTLFASNQGPITPDFLCLSKGLTGGYLPLSAVLTLESIYGAFYAEHAAGKAFLHSHSYTGNALACRAALATLDLLTETTLIRNHTLAQKMKAAVETLQDHPNVAEIRQTGMILAIELVKDKKTREPFDKAERLGHRVYRHGLTAGVLLRPLGDVMYFMPPYVISLDEIELMATTAIEGIHQALKSHP
jgi:adenosylmethionine-8-amino-7-oxononanoate aminotransferase